MGGPAYVSRLRWDRTLAPGDVEVSHSHGQPVPITTPPGAIRVRDWPNRLGILETGMPDDLVRWHRDLTAIEPDGVWTQNPESGADVNDLMHRTRWFVKLLKRLEQIPGATAYTKPQAPCGILLTPGIAPNRLDAIEPVFQNDVKPLAEILPEFPGGLQLRLSETGWARREEYAEAIELLLREDE